MGLIRAIVHGFGVTLGSRAADEAIDLAALKKRVGKAGR
jgi:hypothetical protein